MTFPARVPGIGQGRAGAVVAMFASAALFAVMTALAKWLGRPESGRPIPPGEVTLFRFAFGALVMLPLLAHKETNLLGTDKVGLVWRGVSGGLAVYTYFVAIQQTTITNAVILNMTSVVFAPLFAALLLREALSKAAAPALVVGMLGVLLVTHPAPGAVRSGDVWGLVSGILAGSAITAVRRLRQQESASSVFFYFSLLGIPVSAAGCLGARWVWPTTMGWWVLVGMAAASVGAQILMTYGYRFVRTAEGVLMTLTQIVYSAVIGAIWFSEPVGWMTAAGAALVLGAGIYAGTARGRAMRRAPA